MIKNRLIDQVWCLDQNTDSLELIETICFNTIVLDLRAENDNCVTHVIINQKWLRSSLRASENGLREVTMKIIEKRLPIKINWLVVNFLVLIAMIILQVILLMRVFSIGLMTQKVKQSFE